MPPIETVIPTTISVPDLPPVIQALHQARNDIQALDILAVDYYNDLRISSVLLSPDLPPRSHCDGGALATISDSLKYFWNYHEFTPEERVQQPRLKVADATLHTPVGIGYLKIPCRQAPGYVFVIAFYILTIPATILSPDSLGRDLDCKGYHTYSDFKDDRALLQMIKCSSCTGDLHFDLQRIRGLLFMDPLIAPTEEEHHGPLPEPPSNSTCTTPSIGLQFQDAIPVNALSLDQQRALWHMRLGHVNQRMVSDLHKYADGVPKLPQSDDLHKCPMCTKAKIHKSRCNDEEENEATACWQDI